MRPKGTIFQSGKSGTHGEFILFLPVLLRLTYNFIRGVGAGLIAFAVLTYAFSFGPVIQQELSYRFGSHKQVDQDNFNISVAEADRVLEVQKEANTRGVGSYFSVVIPIIDASSNVIANVDTSNKFEYLEALKKGIAHAKGTYFPGQEGTIFLFSHSTDSPLNFARYNTIFYLLGKLDKGDEIIVYFSDKKYRYEVTEKVIAEVSDTSWLNGKQEGEKLILMTCDPPGTTWRRLLIIAEPVAK